MQEAAKTAIKKLSESDHQPISRLAKEVLEPKPQPVPQQGIQFGPAQIQVQFQVGGGQRVQVKSVNGVKDIEAHENGRTVKIHDDPKQGITVEVTEKKDGKDVTKKYQAKDAAELKKKHPAAHKLYEKYDQQGRGMQIQAFQVPAMQLQQIPGGFNVKVPPVLGDVQEVAGKLKKVSGHLDNAQTA